MCPACVDAGAWCAPAPHHRARRLAVLQGFSLHADTAVHGHDRQGLERLARYGARGPVAESRLRRLDDGRYEYSPKKGSAFTLTASALVRRLVALLPPARLHLTSFHGALAPNARLRKLVTQPPSHQRRCPALRFRPRNPSGPVWIGPNFTSTPSAMTSCDARAAAGAPSARCTPLASRPRPASPSSASRSLRGCCLRPLLPLSCSSRCEGERHLPLHADSDRRATGVFGPLCHRLTST